MPTKESRLTRERIDTAGVLSSVEDPGSGAVVLFLGTVRDSSEAGMVQRIDYEAYESMAEKSLASAEAEVRRRWPSVKAVRIVHRTGALDVGEVSVAVAVSSPHRAEAFAACRCAIDLVKREAPIWKKEKLADGRESWVEGHPLGRPRKSAGQRKKASSKQRISLEKGARNARIA